MDPNAAIPLTRDQALHWLHTLNFGMGPTLETRGGLAGHLWFQRRVKRFRGRAVDDRVWVGGNDSRGDINDILWELKDLKEGLEVIEGNLLAALGDYLPSATTFPETPCNEDDRIVQPAPSPWRFDGKDGADIQLLPRNVEESPSFSM
ncbi:MAG: hypothetical protein Q9216_001821 [Gyalolechia sp. 2 TL-2023]